MSYRGGNMVSIGRVLPSNAFKYNLFQYALDGKAKKILHLFSESGADLNVDICNSRGQTALFVSCITGHFKCVVTLLQLGSNPNKRSDDGSTPTHAAAFSCNLSLLQVVVDHGGDLRLHDHRDLVPKDWAVEAGSKRNKKVIELIDRLHDEAISTILSSKNLLTYKYNKSSSASLSRIMGSNEALPIAAAKPARQPKIFKHGFGDFVSIPMVSSGTGPNGKLTEVGFLALTPIINKDHLFHAATEPSITYQAPPWFLLTNGFLGSQAITIKKINKVKKKVSRQYVNTHDLLIAELNTNRLLSHPNVLLLMGVCMESWNEKCESDNQVTNNLLVPHCFVYERVSLGSLYHLLHVKHQRLPLRDSTLLLLQIADALSYLHQRGFIHCCISAYSIQIINSYTAKLSDFYYAIYSESNYENRQQIYPAFNRWLAPEILAEKRPSIESDIYSFCVVACEAMSGALPWQGYDPDSIRHHVVAKGHVQPIPVEVPEYFRPLLSQGLCLSRRKRAVKLTQITFSLQYIYKFGNISACEGNEESGNFSPSLSPTKCDKTFGDMGLDVPDAVPFDTPVGRKPQRLVETDGKSHSADTPNTNRSFSVGDSRVYKTMPQPSMHSTRCLSRNEANCARIQPVSVPTVGNRQSSIRVSIHSGDFYPKVNNSDDDIGCIHPDLCSTDSANTSVAGSSIFYPSKNYGSRLDDVDCTPTKTLGEDVACTPVHTSVKKEIDKTLLTTQCSASVPDKGSSEATAEKRCKSPYPNLTDCKSSLGEYVLSGMSDIQDTTVPKCVETEQSPVSVTSSYLSNVFPKSFENSRSTEERNSFDLKNPVANDKARLSSGSVVNDINFNPQGRDSPLHNSVQKVRHSLVELSMMLQPQSDPILPTHLPGVDASPSELVGNKDVVGSDQRDRFLPAVRDLTKLPEAEEFALKVLSDENLKFPQTTSTFFDEVISATGMQGLQSASPDRESKRSRHNISHATSSSSSGSSEALSQKSDFVYTNVAQWKQAVKNATRRHSGRITPKSGRKEEAGYSPGAEKQSYPEMVSGNAKSETGRSSADSRKSDNIKVLFSTFKQPCKSKTELTIKDPIVAGLNQQKKNSLAKPYFPECSTDNSSQLASSQTTSIDGKMPMPHPSAFYPYEDVLPVSTEEESPKKVSLNNPHQRDSSPNVTSEKRFSISSADLEEIFSSFADRPSVHETEPVSEEIRPQESVLCNQHPSHFCGLDVSDGPRVVSREPPQVAQLPSCPPRKASSRKKLMLSKACQTDGKKASRTTQIDDRNVNSKNNRVAVHPRSPPVVKDFLQKTGDWTSILHHMKKKKETSCDMTRKKVDAEPLATKERDSKPSVENVSEPLEVKYDAKSAAGMSCHEMDLEVSDAVNDISRNAFASYSSPQTTQCPNDLKTSSYARSDDATCCVLQDADAKQPMISSTKSNEQDLKSRPDRGVAVFKQTAIQDCVEIDNIPQLTPSKMSFQNKLSLFESKLNADSKPVSPERASSVDQSVLQKMSGIPYPKPIYHTSSLKQVCDLKHCVQANITNTSQNSCDFHQAENTVSSSQADEGSRAYVTATEEEDDELLTSSPAPNLSSFKQENDFETSTPVLNRTNNVCPLPAGDTQNSSTTEGEISKVSPLISHPQVLVNTAPSLADEDSKLKHSSAVNMKNYVVKKKSSLPRLQSLPDIREITDFADSHPGFIQTSNTNEDHLKTRVEILCPDTNFSRSNSLISEDSSSSSEPFNVAKNSQLENGIDSLANSVTEDVLGNLMTSNEEDEPRRHKEDDVCEDSVYVDADTQGKDAGDHAILQMSDPGMQNVGKEDRPFSVEYQTSIWLDSHVSEDQIPESDKEVVSDSVLDKGTETS